MLSIYKVRFISRYLCRYVQRNISMIPMYQVTYRKLSKYTKYMSQAFQAKSNISQAIQA